MFGKHGLFEQFSEGIAAVGRLVLAADFVFFHPIFNIADAAISTGIIALLLFYHKHLGFSSADGNDAYQGYADHIANRFASAPVQAHQIIYAGYYGGYAE